MSPDDLSEIPDQVLYEGEHALRKIDDKDKSPEEFQKAFRLAREIRRRVIAVCPTQNGGSVFDSQLPVNSLRSMIYLTERELERLKAQLEKATKAHRDQIRKSLVSTIHAEREAAESIAPYWDVPLSD